MKRKVGIIGLGLLGGSLAKGLAKYTDYEVIGYARRPEICEAALVDKVVARAYTDPKQVVAEADILVFALPPDTNARLFEELAPLIRPRTLITDVSSTKTNFAGTVKQHLPEGAKFVSIHPMAGSEKAAMTWPRRICLRIAHGLSWKMTLKTVGMRRLRLNWLKWANCWAAA